MHFTGKTRTLDGLLDRLDQFTKGELVHGSNNVCCGQGLPTAGLGHVIGSIRQGEFPAKFDRGKMRQDTPAKSRGWV